MIPGSLRSRLSFYGLVCVAASSVHALVLLGLDLLMPLWLANPLAFLAASLAGYLGHARFTFKPETGDQRFARRWLERQLGLEVEAQIRQFRTLGAAGPIHLAGHQHIHLVPVVLDAVLKHAATQQIIWLRRTDEPLPTGLPLSDWWQTIWDANLLTWLVLQLLSRRAQPAMRRHGINSNQSFAGVLFTGRMAGDPLRAAWSTLRSTKMDGSDTPPVLLSHPAAPLAIDLNQAGFAMSQPFASSPWRQKEWEALQAL